MPLYEFQCHDCDDRFDRLVRSFDAAGEVTCTQCDSPNVRLLVSSFAVTGALDSPAETPRGAGGCCGGSCGCGGH